MKKESLQIAIENEAREEKYYLAQAERSRNPVVKRLLHHLAEEELAHQEWISKRHRYMLETGQWPEHIELEPSGQSLRDAMRTIDYRNEKTSLHDDDDIACLNRAAQFEMEAAEFYSRLARDSNSPREQSFFSYLAKMEQDHMASIRDSLAYLEDPEGYFLSKADH